MAGAFSVLEEEFWAETFYVLGGEVELAARFGTEIVGDYPLA